MPASPAPHAEPPPSAEQHADRHHGRRTPAGRLPRWSQRRGPNAGVKDRRATYMSVVMRARISTCCCGVGGGPLRTAPEAEAAVAAEVANAPGVLGMV